MTQFVALFHGWNETKRVHKETFGEDFALPMTFRTLRTDSPDGLSYYETQFHPNGPIVKWPRTQDWRLVYLAPRGPVTVAGYWNGRPESMPALLVAKAKSVRDHRDQYADYLVECFPHAREALTWHLLANRLEELLRRIPVMV